MKVGEFRLLLADPAPVIERAQLLNQDQWLESLYACVTCGAVVFAPDVDKHLNWHLKRDEQVATT